MPLFQPDVSQAPPESGSFWVRKAGPLPVWAWGGIGIGLAIIVRSYLGSRSQATQDTTGTDLSGTTTPPTVYQDYITITNPIVTNPDEPPGQGRSEPPQMHIPTPPVQSVPVSARPPAPTPTPPKSAPAPTGRWVTVTRWTARNTPWNSTISTIAAHYGIKNWQSVWNAPQNASLKARRKKPELIQPGDRVWVPA